MRDLLWLTPLEALAVVIATAGMYVALVILVRVLGQRMLSGLSSFDLAAVIAFGAILGRASLGHVPVLGGGLVALLTLVAMQGLAGMMRLIPVGREMVTTHPVLLMADGQVFHDQLRRAHVSPGELQSRLRIHGVHRYDDVAAALLEPNGMLSILRAGTPIDPRLLSGVIGASLVPEDLLER